MPLDPVALRTDIKTGPNSATLLPLLNASNYQGLADALNNRATGGANVDEDEVTARQLLGCVVGSEYIAASWTTAMRELWKDILAEASQNKAPIKNTAFRNLVLAAVPSAATVTRANLSALQTRLGSRIEILFGVGQTIDATTLQSWAPYLKS